jgi:hypothetical protein
MGERERDRAEAWGDGWRAGWEAAWAQMEAESAVQVGSVSVSAGQARAMDDRALRIVEALEAVGIGGAAADDIADAIIDAIADKRWQR